MKRQVFNEKPYFQSSNRNTDICMVRLSYAPHRYLKSDYIWPVGSYDFHVLSGAPPERKKYLMLILPFDSFTWAFIIGSVVGVSAILILTNVIWSILPIESHNETVFQCEIKSCWQIINTIKLFPLFQVSHFQLELSLMKLKEHIVTTTMLTNSHHQMLGH